MRSVLTLLANVAKSFPQRTYLSGKHDQGWSNISFAQTEKITNEVAAWWLLQSIPQGERIALLAEGRPEWVLAELGMLKAGLISVPLSLKLQSNEIPFRLNHASVAAVIASNITLPKILDGWNQFQKKPFLILLDSPKQDAAGRLKGMKLQEHHDWICWTEVLDHGAAALLSQPRVVESSMATITEDTPVNICYTSGTTGNPKGIMLSHLNYYTNATSAVSHFGLPLAKYETLVILPLDHSFAHTVAIYAGLAKAITLSFVDAREGALSILRNIPINLKERNPTFILTVPAITGNFMRKIIEGIHTKGPLIQHIFHQGIEAGMAIIGDGYTKPSFMTKLRYGFAHALAKALIFPKTKAVFGNSILFCVGGGAILEAKQQHFYAAMGLPVYQGYGLTEAAPIISANTPTQHKFGSSGKVMPSVNCQIIITEEDGKGGTREREAAWGEIGEIVIQSKSVMLGYYKNPEASQEVLRNGSLYTGDLGYFDQDGFLMVVGRQKALLISSDGEKYPPETIEEAIGAKTNVFSQIMAYNDQMRHTTALVTLDVHQCQALFHQKGITNAQAALTLLEAEFEAYRQDDGGKSIPPAWRPTAFEIIPKAFSEEDGLVNSTMKLMRRKVIERYEDRIQALYQDLDSQNPRNTETLNGLFDF